MSIKVSLGAAVGLMAITAAVTFIITSNVTLDRFNQKIKSVSEIPTAVPITSAR